MLRKEGGETLMCFPLQRKALGKKPSVGESTGFDWEEREDRQTLQVPIDRHDGDSAQVTTWKFLFPICSRFGSRKSVRTIPCSSFWWTLCKMYLSLQS
jgi:hypothetical protein